MNSSYLKRFDFLTHGPIAELACLSKPKEPVNEQTMHFPEKLSQTALAIEYVNIAARVLAAA